MQGIPRWLVALRLAAFAALVAFMFGGPFYRQVLDGRSKYFRNWVMFHGFGRDICDVEYRHHKADGSVEVLDWATTLEYRSWLHAPRSVRRLKKVDDARRLGRRICTRLDPDERDLRLHARCGSRQGWKPADDGEENLCVYKPKPQKKRAPKKDAPETAPPEVKP